MHTTVGWSIWVVMRWVAGVRVALLWMALGLSLYMIFRLISAPDADTVLRFRFRKTKARARPSVLTAQPSPTSGEDTTPVRLLNPKAQTNVSSFGNKSDLFPAVRITGKQRSRFAYVTLLHGIDTTISYRGFLYNCVLMKQALQAAGSTADFLVLVGFTHGVAPQDSPTITSDLLLLEDYGLRLVYLPRLLPPNLAKWEKAGSKIQFHEMALLKVLPWSFTQYDRVQFMDGDVLPHSNMDCLFQLNRNTFNTGTASPLNSGWYLALPRPDDFSTLLHLAQWRLTAPRWDELKGWGTPIPSTLKYRGFGRVVKKWDFNGASLDQGLCTHHFVLHQGRAQLLDQHVATVYDANYSSTEMPLEQVLGVCGSEPGLATKPVDMFYHFTGRNKPWLQDLVHPRDNDKALKHWIQAFEAARFNITAAQLAEKKMKSPLGYFYPNK